MLQFLEGSVDGKGPIALSFGRCGAVSDEQRAEPIDKELADHRNEVRCARLPKGINNPSNSNLVQRRTHSVSLEVPSEGQPPAP